MNKVFRRIEVRRDYLWVRHCEKFGISTDVIVVLAKPKCQTGTLRKTTTLSGIYIKNEENSVHGWDARNFEEVDEIEALLVRKIEK